MGFLPPAAPRRPPPDAALPMVNLVFLLLVFVLMVARLAPPAPLPVTPPEGRGAERPEPEALHIAADGTLAWGALRGEAAIAAALAADGPLDLRADAALPAARLARLLARAAAAGRTEVRLILREAGR